MGKTDTTTTVAEQQPDELGALSESIKEFMERWRALENEVELLKQDQKDLKSEFESRLDIKTLNAVIRVLKLEAAVKHKHTYDQMMEVCRETGIAGV